MCIINVKHDYGFDLREERRRDGREEPISDYSLREPANFAGLLIKRFVAFLSLCLASPLPKFDHDHRQAREEIVLESRIWVTVTRKSLILLLHRMLLNWRILLFLLLAF